MSDKLALQSAFLILFQSLLTVLGGAPAWSCVARTHMPSQPRPVLAERLRAISGTFAWRLATTQAVRNPSHYPPGCSRLFRNRWVLRPPPRLSPLPISILRARF